MVGFKKGDQEENARLMAEKLANLRIFEDQEGKMNLSALDKQAQILAVSQFTLYADTGRGRRPSFFEALEPEVAEQLYHKFTERLKEYKLRVETGVFGAKMLVELKNDGPVTLILDT